MYNTDETTVTISSIMTKIGATYTAGDRVLSEVCLMVVVLAAAVEVVAVPVPSNSNLWSCAKAAPKAVKPAIVDSLLKKPSLVFDTIAGFSNAYRNVTTLLSFIKSITNKSFSVNTVTF